MKICHKDTERLLYFQRKVRNRQLLKKLLLASITIAIAILITK